MATREKISHARHLLGLLVADPRQARHLDRWRRELRRPTIESGLPWLPFDLVTALESVVGPGTRVFEYGGGGSTLWFADRGASVTTVEHDGAWVEELQQLTAGAADRVRIIPVADPESEAYVNAIAAVPGPFDVVVVDGRERVRCLEYAMPHVAPEGWLVLDDTDRDRYAPAAISAAGWPAAVYRGLAPFKPVPAHTTVWRRPA